MRFASTLAYSIQPNQGSLGQWRRRYQGRIRRRRISGIFLRLHRRRAPRAASWGGIFRIARKFRSKRPNHLMRSCPTMKSRPFSSMVRVGCGLLLSVTDPAARNCQIRNLLTQHPMRRPVSNRARLVGNSGADGLGVEPGIAKRWLSRLGRRAGRAIVSLPTRDPAATLADLLVAPRRGGR